MAITGPWYFQIHLESPFHKTGPTSVFIGTTLHLQKVMERIDVFQYLVLIHKHYVPFHQFTFNFF